MAFFRSLARIFTSLIAGIVILLLVTQDKMIYHPRPYPDAGIRQSRREIQALPYTTSEGGQTCYFVPPESGPATLNPQEPVWVLFCGNASLALEWMGLVNSYPDKDAAFLLIDYPGYGACSGRPSPVSIQESADAALATLAETLKLPQAQIETRLKVMGHSLGAANALAFASRHAASSVVLVAPFSSLRDMARRSVGWPLCYLLLGNFDNRARMREIVNRPSVPDIHILSGIEDDLIPCAMGRELAGISSQVHFEAIDGAGHNDILTLAQDRIFSAMRGSAKKP